VAGDINHVVLVGRLTRDPELRNLPSGGGVLSLGLAVNGRQKDGTGNWVDKPNFFDVKVFGNQAEMLVNHLAKGRRIGVDGRLDWQSWEASDGSGKRSKVEVIANTVQFLDSRGDVEGGGGGGGQFVPQGTGQGSDFTPQPTDDDIPF
jgi:single-strand DNA-binding protein